MGKNKLIRNEEFENRNYPSVSLMAEEKSSLSSGNLRFFAIPNSSFLIPNSAVGCVDLYNYDPLNKRAAVAIVVASQYRRQGFALAMLHELSLLAHLTFHLHTLYADIASSNNASITLFSMAGFHQCGLFRDWLLVNEQYIDSIRMQKTL